MISLSGDGCTMVHGERGVALGLDHVARERYTSLIGCAVRKHSSLFLGNGCITGISVIGVHLFSDYASWQWLADFILFAEEEQ